MSGRVAASLSRFSTRLCTGRCLGRPPRFLPFRSGVAGCFICRFFHHVPAISYCCDQGQLELCKFGIQTTICRSWATLWYFLFMDLACNFILHFLLKNLNIIFKSGQGLGNFKMIGCGRHIGGDDAARSDVITCEPAFPSDFNLG